MLRIFIAVICTAVALAAVQLGMQWIEVGHGLHPILAFPMATVCIFVIAIMVAVSREMAEHDAHYVEQGRKMYEPYNHSNQTH